MHSMGDRQRVKEHGQSMKSRIRQMKLIQEMMEVVIYVHEVNTDTQWSEHYLLFAC